MEESPDEAGPDTPQMALIQDTLARCMEKADDLDLRMDAAHVWTLLFDPDHANQQEQCILEMAGEDQHTLIKALHWSTMHCTQPDRVFDVSMLLHVYTRQFCMDWPRAPSNRTSTKAKAKGKHGKRV